jgi:hypothetical protein
VLVPEPAAIESLIATLRGIGSLTRTELDRLCAEIAQPFVPGPAAKLGLATIPGPASSTGCAVDEGVI